MQRRLAGFTCKRACMCRASQALRGQGLPFHFKTSIRPEINNSKRLHPCRKQMDAGSWRGSIYLVPLCLWLCSRLWIGPPVPAEKRDWVRSPKAGAWVPKRRWVRRKEALQKKRAPGRVIRQSWGGGQKNLSWNQWKGVPEGSGKLCNLRVEGSDQ